VALPLGLARVIGHRGAPKRAPENTVAAFRLAAALGAGWVELDAKLSKDGVPMVIHDETVDRTTDGHGDVRATTAATLATLDAGGWFSPDFRGEPLPTLETALRAIAEAGLGANVEIKACPGRERETARAVIDTTRRVWPQRLPAPIYSSFAVGALEAARAHAPDAIRGLLLDGFQRDWNELAERLDCRAVHPRASALTAAWVAEIKASGRATLTWTVNDPKRAELLVSWGVDAVITDVPDRLVPVLAAA
jgi:glycerophosphoryl diester phosphodiesterase